MAWSPERGDIVWVNLDPTEGHEEAGRRPALVLSPSGYNRRVGMAVMCPITNRVKGYPFEVPVAEGLPVAGVVLADQVRCMDWRARGSELVCAAPAECVDAASALLSTLTGR